MKAAPVTELVGQAHGTDDRHGNTHRWSPLVLLLVSLSFLVAATQVLVWVKAVEARGGLEVYVRGIDLMPTLAGGLAIRAGDGPRLYDFATQLAAQRRVRAPYLTLGDEQVLPYIHPPFEALLIAPLLDLPYAVLYGALTLGALISVGVSLWLIANELPVGWAARWALVAAACSYQPLHQALWLGQTSPFVLLGICGTYVALNRRREHWAALPLLLVTLKPQVFLVVALLVLLLGHWRAPLIAAGVLGLAGVAAMPILGIDWPLRYARFLSVIAGWDQPHAVYPASMPTIRGLAVTLVGERFPGLVAPAVSALSAALLGLLLWSWWRARATASTIPRLSVVPRLRRDLLWALTCLVAVLVPVHMGPHDHTLLLFPAWLLASHAVAGVWHRLLTAFWLALLWGGYTIALLTPFVMEAPHIVVVPGVLLMLAATGVLAWQITTAPVGATAAAAP